MGWTKNRDKLHEAAISTIRAISKNKQISSNTGLSQRPPTSNHIVVPAVPPVLSVIAAAVTLSTVLSAVVYDD